MECIANIFLLVNPKYQKYKVMAIFAIVFLRMSQIMAYSRQINWILHPLKIPACREEFSSWLEKNSAQVFCIMKLIQDINIARYDLQNK